jgi:hypothetical protein
MNIKNLIRSQNWSPILQAFLSIILSVFLLTSGYFFIQSKQIIWNLSLAPILLFGFLNPLIFVFFQTPKKYIPLSFFLFIVLLSINYFIGVEITDNFKGNYNENLLVYQLLVLFFFLIYIIAGLFKGIVYILENN